MKFFNPNFHQTMILKDKWFTWKIDLQLHIFKMKNRRLKPEMIIIIYCYFNQSVKNSLRSLPNLIKSEFGAFLKL